MDFIVASGLLFTVAFIGLFYNEYHDLKEAKGTKNYPFVWARVVIVRLALSFGL